MFEVGWVGGVEGWDADGLLGVRLMRSSSGIVRSDDEGLWGYGQLDIQRLICVLWVADERAQEPFRPTN